MMAKKMTAILICMLLIATGFAGCSGTQESDTIVFGAALPLTGDLSTEGKKHQDGYNLWMDTVNAAGGITIDGQQYLVEIQYADYKSDNATAVKLVEKFITEDNIQLIFGPMGSAAAKAVSVVTEKYQVPMIAPSASSEEVFTEGFQYLFGTYTPNRTLTEPLADLASGLPQGPESVAIIARNDLFPLAVGNEAEASAQSHGIRVTMFEQYAVGTTDFAPTLIQLSKDMPDWLFVTGYANDLILVSKQMQELNIEPDMITMVAGAAYQEFIDGAGAEAEGVTTACWWHNSVQYQGEDIFGTAEEYTALYEETYDYTPDYTCATASAVGVLFQRAIENAGSTDPQEVRDAISALDFTTFYGPIKFDQRGMLTSLTPPVLQIMDGKHVPVYPPEIAEGELQYPRR